MTYLLDANVFIQAKNLYYGLDFCPAFWQWLIEQNQTGKVVSIDKIKDEIIAGEDQLSQWVKEQGQQMFKTTSGEIIPYLKKVSQWAQEQNYETVAINSFFQVADYYLLVQALAGNYTIVTHEVPSNSNKRIKIPNACMGLNISFTNTFNMLRMEGALFVLAGN